MAAMGFRRATLGVTAASTIFVTWNTLDEYWVLQHWYNVLLVILAWLLVPYAAALAGTVAQKPFQRAVCLVVAIVCAAIFLTYALNGSTRPRTLYGVQHLHVILVPVLLPMLAILLVAVLYLAYALYRLGIVAARRGAAVPREKEH